ncbi:hypothetical protein NC653_000319 [Populus alba x Populus x berolinensis]|nr:hypothetical protein NC653_000319 [Populus alba x Populus x berolinensis]
MGPCSDLRGLGVLLGEDPRGRGMGPDPRGLGLCLDPKGLEFGFVSRFKGVRLGGDPKWLRDRFVFGSKGVESSGDPKGLRDGSGPKGSLDPLGGLGARSVSRPKGVWPSGELRGLGSCPDAIGLGFGSMAGPKGVKDGVVSEA